MKPPAKEQRPFYTDNAILLHLLGFEACYKPSHIKSYYDKLTALSPRVTNRVNSSTEYDGATIETGTYNVSYRYDHFESIDTPCEFVNVIVPQNGQAAYLHRHISRSHHIDKNPILNQWIKSIESRYDGVQNNFAQAALEATNCKHYRQKQKHLGQQVAPLTKELFIRKAGNNLMLFCGHSIIVNTKSGIDGYYELRHSMVFDGNGKCIKSLFSKNPHNTDGLYIPASLKLTR